VQRTGVAAPAERVALIAAEERARGIDRFETFERFAAATTKIKVDLHRFIRQIQAEGKRIAGYGAPAKGNTLLSFLGLGPENIAYIADRSPLKQGLYTPGTHIPVVPPQHLLDDRPEYVLLLAWNFAEEILQQLSPYREQGGRFVLPVPEVRVL
jgi:hypothetical protein